MRNLLSLAVGLIFGVGLCISGMTDPAKVLGFLDLAGLWDPSLAFVMGGAVAVGLVAFSLAKRRTVALDGEPMQMPTARAIDAPSDVLPTPGGPTRQRIGPRKSFFNFATARNCKILRLTG